MDFPTTILYIIILIMSIVLHETAHGYMAEYLGDPTARLQGRLTLNPIKHLDLFGSILLPGLLIIMGSPLLLGWAKPVPFNQYNFKRHRKWGSALVALAGPVSNILFALIFSGILRILALVGELNPAFILIGVIIVLLNITLALFNLIPVPPLDGHHILFAFIPERFNNIKQLIHRYQFVLLLVVVFFGARFIQPAVLALVNIFLGQEVMHMAGSIF